MQIYPQRLILAAVCFLVTPVGYYSAGYCDYIGMYPISTVLTIFWVCCAIAGIGFILTSVNVEVWDSCYRRI
jgi:uncharacterized membrane protein